ncbi:putative ribosomal protein L27/L41 [Helianthus annuus]|nr:putative ribosomal protein L27/L41 [Helianthus annuus]
MALGLFLGIARAYKRTRTSSLNSLTSKTGPCDYHKGKNCKPTDFHSRKGSCFEYDFSVFYYVFLLN